MAWHPALTSKLQKSSDCDCKHVVGFGLDGQGCDNQADYSIQYHSSYGSCFVWQVVVEDEEHGVHWQVCRKLHGDCCLCAKQQRLPWYVSSKRLALDQPYGSWRGELLLLNQLSWEVQAKAAAHLALARLALK